MSSRRKAALVVALGVTSLAATSLAAMLASSELLVESFDRPLPRPLDPPVPDLGTLGTIEVEPPEDPPEQPRGGPWEPEAKPPGRQPAAQPAGERLVPAVRRQPARQRVLVVRQPASRPRPATRPAPPVHRPAPPARPTPPVTHPAKPAPPVGHPAKPVRPPRLRPPWHEPAHPPRPETRHPGRKPRPGWTPNPRPRRHWPPPPDPRGWPCSDRPRRDDDDDEPRRGFRSRRDGEHHRPGRHWDGGHYRTAPSRPHDDDRGRWRDRDHRDQDGGPERARGSLDVDVGGVPEPDPV